MSIVIEITQASNFVYDFTCSEPISLSHLCLFFTASNLAFSERDLAKVGLIGTHIITQSLEFRDVLQVFVSDCRVTIVFRQSAGVQTLLEQIARIIEKAFDERGISSEFSR